MSFKIYILPISGGGFVAQLGLLAELYQSYEKNGIKYTPNICFASSGGNISSYLAMIDNWTNVGIDKHIRILTPDYFIKSWTPPFLPTWIALPFTGSIYRRGGGIKKFFKSKYNNVTVQRTEIWSGSYNNTTQRSIQFSNKSKQNSFLKEDEPNILYDKDKSVYLNGDLNKIADITYASAAIPVLTQRLDWNGHELTDGGVIYSSPLIPLSKSLIKLIEQKKRESKKIQITYFCSYDMNMKFKDSLYSIIISNLIHSSLLQDRAFAINIGRIFTKNTKEPTHYSFNDTDYFSKILNEFKNLNYLMILYPKDAPSVNITSFKMEDIVREYENSRKQYSAFIWKLD